MEADSFGCLDPEASAAEMRRILAGGDGARADFTAMEAGLALTVAGRAKDFASGVARARDVLESGQGLEKLEALLDAVRRGPAH
jgi:anthranilate phosphoribosyltransferase